MPVTVVAAQHKSLRDTTATPPHPPPPNQLTSPQDNDVSVRAALDEPLVILNWISLACGQDHAGEAKT